MKAKRGNIGRYSSTLSLTLALDGGVDVTPWPLYPREIYPVPFVREVGWAPGPVCTGAENLAATGIRSPDRSACSESLYRLLYPGLQILRVYSANVTYTGLHK
jgi:hypothetical protein